ncbi:hypothetical protein RB195_016602 [Necator americanus]|uniref:Secreted protein n=1 Tax=Necator americanus TaxID=51031 RepID=A0ABR1C188_NECAM
MEGMCFPFLYSKSYWREYLCVLCVSGGCRSDSRLYELRHATLRTSSLVLRTLVRRRSVPSCLLKRCTATNAVRLHH